jgi:hypothetical protein
LREAMPIADVKRDLEAIAIAEFAAHETKKAELVGDPRAVLVERIGASGNHDDATSKLPVCIGHERLRLPTSVLRHRSWVRSVRVRLTAVDQPRAAPPLSGFSSCPSQWQTTSQASDTDVATASVSPPGPLSRASSRTRIRSDGSEGPASNHVRTSSTRIPSSVGVMLPILRGGHHRVVTHSGPPG